MSKTIEGLRYLTMFPNWDEDGALQIPSAVWDKLLATLAILGKPSISPAADGTVHLNWHLPDGHTLVAELSMAGTQWSHI